MLTISNANKNLLVVWDALFDYREQCAPPQINGELISQNDVVWDKICEAMARLTEDLGLDTMEIDG